MEERRNKTIICSVLFLEIIEYSRKSVSGQISLKDRLNRYLSVAIRDVPMIDRIILDTGDGAAINFLGDIEDALKAALSLRESLLKERPDIDHPLLIRMGINLGPVRLVRDINGQPNIVGDGINVAQRVMGFADVDQILASRSYCDAVSRLSPQYAGMFHYQGSRTDKHVREHEVYAIGYPGDKTTLRGTTKQVAAEQDESILSRAMPRAKSVWRSAATGLDALIDQKIIRFRKTGYWLRTVYIAVIVVPLLLLVALLTNLSRHDEVPAMPDEQAVKTVQSGVAPVAPVSVVSGVKIEGAIPAPSPTMANPKINKNIANQNAQEPPRGQHESKPRDKPEDKLKPKHSEHQAKIINKKDIERNATVVTASGSADANLSVYCLEGTEVFVDSIRKGRVGSSPLVIAATPGKHTVIVSLTGRGVFHQIVTLNSGKSVHIKPGLCN